MNNETQNTIAPETVVYDIKGNAASVSLKHPTASGYLVHPLYEYHDNECGPSTEFGSLTHWPQVYLTPPTEKRHAEIERLDAELATRRAELAQMQSTRFSIQRTEKEDTARLEKLSMRSRAISRIEDFLDGKLTHYLTVGQYKYRKNYEGGFEIVDVKDMKCDEKSRSGPLRLLTLFGKEPGNLEFRLSRYSDGSDAESSYKLVWPFCSEDEARQRAKEMTEEQLVNWREDPKRTDCRTLRLNCANYLGDVPEDVEAAVKARSIETEERLVVMAKENLAKAEAKLEAAKAVTE